MQSIVVFYSRMNWAISKKVSSVFVPSGVLITHILDILLENRLIASYTISSYDCIRVFLRYVNGKPVFRGIKPISKNVKPIFNKKGAFIRHLVLISSSACGLTFQKGTSLFGGKELFYVIF